MIGDAVLRFIERVRERAKTVNPLGSPQLLTVIGHAFNEIAKEHESK